MGITLRDVEEQSRKIAEEQGNSEFVISNHWLTRLENSDSVPSIYKLFTISATYQIKFSDLLSMFGVNVGLLAQYGREASSQRTNILKLEGGSSAGSVTFPVRFDPAFNIQETNLLSRLVQIWGEVPIPLIQRLDFRHGQYGYIGLSDYTMYPLLRPGSFVQVDPHSRKIEKRSWRTEFDRPIYFVELRDGYACSWCEQQAGELLLIPHPLSPSVTRRIDRKSVEIIGQVTAAAMRIVDPALADPDGAHRSPK